MKRPEKIGFKKDRHTALTVHRHRCVSYRFELSPLSHLFYLLYHLITASLKKHHPIYLWQTLLNTSDWHKRRYGIHLTSNGCLTHDLPHPRWLSRSSARSPALPPQPGRQTLDGSSRLVVGMWKCLQEKELLWGFFFFLPRSRCSERDNRLLSYTLKSCRGYRITDGDGDLKSPGSLNHNTDGGWRDDFFTMTDSTPACQDVRGELNWWDD